jgi:histone deacetylase 1/2
MENLNSVDYLEKIKTQVIENLKKTTFAPSVQMQDVPRQPLGGMTDEEEAELDDLDEDENKDVRNTQRRSEQRIHRDDEFEDSDDEEDARMNGAMPQPGLKKKKNIMDYQNPDAAPDSGENGGPTPELTMEDADGIPPAVASEMNAEVAAEVMLNKRLDILKETEAGPSNAASRGSSPTQALDEEGDVDMTEPPVDTEAAAPAENLASLVRTPPKSPVPKIENFAPEPAPEAPSAPEAPAAADPADAADAMDTERDAENVTGEASAEIAKEQEA